MFCAYGYFDEEVLLISFCYGENLPPLMRFKHKKTVFVNSLFIFSAFRVVVLVTQGNYLALKKPICLKYVSLNATTYVKFLLFFSHSIKLFCYESLWMIYSNTIRILVSKLLKFNIWVHISKFGIEFLQFTVYFSSSATYRLSIRMVFGSIMVTD